MKSILGKIEEAIFCLFIFCIPFQMRVILGQWTRPFNEWTVSFLYLTDILLAAVLVLWLARLLIKNNFDWRFYKTIPIWGWALAAFFVISAVSVFFARIPALSFFRLAKLTEFILLFLYVKFNYGKIFSLEKMAAVAVGSGLFQAIIAIVQYFKQGSVGLKILGESVIGLNIYNVAVFFGTNGIKYLRAYGTTPHSNVLAAFLVAALFAFYFWYAILSKATLVKARVTLGVLAVYTIILFGLLLTFSRTMIGVWGLGALAAFIIAKKYRKQFYPVVVATVIVCGFFAIFFWPQVKSRIHISSDEEAVTQRVLYNEIAGKATTINPYFGSGIGQFVPDLMKKYRYYPQYFYQPAHNVYLLISSETGFLGLAAFLIFIISLFWARLDGRLRASSKTAIFPLIVVSCFLLIGLFDHFLWTLQQGSLIFWLVLAMLASYRRN